MRVISGKYKGRKIIVESKSDYRPTLTRIREDIFNLLLHNNDLNIDFNEVILCDLFAGTGSIGIEALSRGVKKVIFNDIEKNHTNKIEKFLKEINEINYEITNFDPYKQKIEILIYCTKNCFLGPLADQHMIEDQQCAGSCRDSCAAPRSHPTMCFLIFYEN